MRDVNAIIIFILMKLKRKNNRFTLERWRYDYSNLKVKSYMQEKKYLRAKFPNLHNRRRTSNSEMAGLRRYVNRPFQVRKNNN